MRAYSLPIKRELLALEEDGPPCVVDTVRLGVKLDSKSHPTDSSKALIRVSSIGGVVVYYGIDRDLALRLQLTASTTHQLDFVVDPVEPQFVTHLLADDGPYPCGRALDT